MWKCPKCGEQHDDQFDACWKCTDAAAVLEDDVVSDEPPPVPQLPPVVPVRCLRCHINLEFIGTKQFHEGTRWGALGDLGELFVNRDRFDVYACPLCGHVEFFIGGIGEEFRPK